MRVRKTISRRRGVDSSTTAFSMSHVLDFRVWDLGFRVFRVWGLGFRVCGLGSVVSDLRFKVRGLSFLGSALRVSG